MEDHELSSANSLAVLLKQNAEALKGRNMLAEVEREGIPYVVLPEGYIIESLEHLLDSPTRKRGIVETDDVGSFVLYVNKHQINGSTTIYADVDYISSNLLLNAIIDDHGADCVETGWKEHRCILKPINSVEWDRWISKNGKLFSQIEFATWLEENLADVVSAEGMPTGADILQMALAFEATSGKRFRSCTRLQNGLNQFEFVEDEDKDTRTRMQLFERFALGLPVFEGSKSAYQITARLKYREKDGRITFWYELIRPDRVFKQAVSDEINRITEGTQLTVIYGRA